MNSPIQRVAIAAQIMAALVARRDSQSALHNAFALHPVTSREERFTSLAADAVAATDALLAALDAAQ